MTWKYVKDKFQAIKDIIVFFVESAIMLIPAITEAILALARGDIAGVAFEKPNGSLSHP
ncbi:MAG: hypothetical protein Crog4KO_05930 [Crocinitomicaceae bacterium]